MKKAALATLILIPLLFYLPSCAPAISSQEYDALQSQLNNAQSELDNALGKTDELTKDLATLQTSHENLQTKYEESQKTYKDLQTKYEESQKTYKDLQTKYEESQSIYKDLQTKYGELQNAYKNLQNVYQGSPPQLADSTLKNPTWAELKEFIKQDSTDTLPYVRDSFDCTGFTITLRDHAWRYGIRCAYGEVSFFEGVGHAFNVFKTTDKGLIYVDNTEGDKIAYVEMNQPYGTIYLDAVRSEYIACEGGPAAFWSPPSRTTHPNPFSYDYYRDYQRRAEFYKNSVAAYNKAVNEYNAGSTKWSYPQLTTWVDNLKALEQDLGSKFLEPAGVVQSIEVYWN